MGRWRTRLAAGLLAWLGLAAASRGQASVPRFFKAECRAFRGLLQEHTDVSRHDRAHATNLGIAAVVLFWSGVPALPLGIASIVTGRRTGTEARAALAAQGVTDGNFEEVNRLCARLLGERELTRISFKGRNKAAIVLGAVAVALAAVVTVLEGCYGVLLCCVREPKTVFPETARDDDVPDADDGPDGPDGPEDDV